MIEKEIKPRFRVRCTATWSPSERGCSEFGWWTWSESEAIKIAEDFGWHVDGETAICPGHLATNKADTVKPDQG